jgi:hypothetical protein
MTENLFNDKEINSTLIPNGLMMILKAEIGKNKSESDVHDILFIKVKMYDENENVYNLTPLYTDIKTATKIKLNRC